MGRLLIATRVLWLYAGKPADALGRYEQALQIKPDFPQAHYGLAIVLEQAGRVPEAIKHLKQALRIQPDLIAA